jgi:two-component system sensor histidine kinase DesK
VSHQHQPAEPDQYEAVGVAIDSARRRPGFGWLMAGVWLFFLNKPFRQILHHDGMAERVLGLVGVIGFVIAYMTFFWYSRSKNMARVKSPLGIRLGFIATLAAFTALMLPAAGVTTLTALVFIEALGMMVLPLPGGVALGVALLAIAELSVQLVPGWRDDGSYGLSIVLGGLAVFAIRRARVGGKERAGGRQGFAGNAGRYVQKPVARAVK